MKRLTETGVREIEGATLVITHRIREGKLDAYEEWLGKITPHSKASPGHLDWHIVRPIPGLTSTYTVIIRFDTDAHLKQWIEYVGNDHLHHRMAAVLGGRKKSVLFIYLMSICLGSSAVLLRNAQPLDAWLLLFQAVLLVGLITVLERRGRSLKPSSDGE